MKISLSERNDRAIWRFEISSARDPLVFLECAGETIRRFDFTIRFFSPTFRTRKNNLPFATSRPAWGQNFIRNSKTNITH